MNTTHIHHKRSKRARQYLARRRRALREFAFGQGAYFQSIGSPRDINPYRSALYRKAFFAGWDKSAGEVHHGKS